MSISVRIAKEELRLLWRDRTAMLGMALLIVLSLIAVVTSLVSRHTVIEERSRYQQQVNEEFTAQPDRHPHRMVHYGQFVFRTTTPWASFDPGIDSFTGHTLFLEGHRQNTANFADVRQSSLLMRFGSLSPAFVLQVLAPLLLIFIGHGMVARERESGTLRILLAQGVKARQLIWGKFFALGLVACCMAVPAIAGIVFIAAQGTQTLIPALVLTGAYLVWLLVCAAMIVLVSSVCRRMRDALFALLVVWTVALILVPRFIPRIAADNHPLLSRIETDIAIHRDVLAIGDSHNPDDPYFARFKQQILDKYGVDKVEDLPVNYKGLVGVEGERLTSELFNDYTERAAKQQFEQNHWVDMFGLIDPVIALRRVSMAIAGTDLQAYLRFAEKAEAYRYRLVQQLNHLQAETISYADDRNPSKQNRVSHQHWHRMPVFEDEPESVAEILRRSAPYLGMLVLWCGVLAGLLPLAARRVQRSV
jgi:ABC-2 type transport system permease protein